MRRFLLQLTVLLGMAICHIGTVSSQEVGLDFLGIKSRAWNCDAMMNALRTLPKPIPCGAFLDDTFGTSDACLRRLLASGKCSSFRGHLAWTNHRPLPASALIPRAKYFDALAAAYPSIRSYGSAICEHPLSAGQSAALNAGLRPFLPHMSGIVDSGMSAADPSAIRECHGPNKKCTAVSLDGQDALDYDVEAFKRNGQLYSLLWGKSFNCKFSDKDKRPPSQRTDCPTPEQFMHYVRLLFPMPPLPPGERPKGMQIVKPSSDNHGGCKGKDCKFLWITNPFKDSRGRPANPNTIPLRAMNGVQIDTLSCYRGKTNCNDPRNWYLNKYPRYYASRGAFPIGQDAERVGGSEHVIIDEGRSRIVVNAYRRAGAPRQ